MYAFFCAEKYTELELVSINIFQDHMLKMLYYMVLQNWEKVLFQYGKRLAILKILCTMLSDFPANCGEDPPGAVPAGPDPGSARFFRAIAACPLRLARGGHKVVIEKCGSRVCCGASAELTRNGLAVHFNPGDV